MCLSTFFFSSLFSFVYFSLLSSLSHFSLFALSLRGSHCIALANLELTILLPQLLSAERHGRTAMPG